MKILLDYLFPIAAIEPTPAASTAFLKQVCVVAKPKAGQEGNVGTIYACTSMTAVGVRTDNTEAQQLFNAGMSKVYVLLSNNLDLATALTSQSDFFTVLISSDFTKTDITAAQATGTITITSYANLLTTTPDSVTVGATVFTAQSGAVTPGGATFRASTDNDTTAASLAAQINAHATAGALVTAVAVAAVVTITAKTAGAAGNIALAYTDNGGGNIGATKSGTALSGGAALLLGTFAGVTGVSSSDDTFLATQAAISNRCAFHTASANGAKNMFYAFGKLLSNALNWRNQQYVPMPLADDVDTLGAANTLFDARISFVISDDEFSTRLAMFCCGGKAIVAPYIKRNLQIDLQSEALQYISGNQPGYTKTAAALLEDELQKVVNSYIDPKAWIEAGVIEITLEEDNFVASGNINIAEPKALWRIFGEMRETL